MIFALLTLLAALALAAVAGWFSIIGLMAILAGQPVAALVLGITLEAGKLVTTSWLYRNWSEAGWSLKAPLIYFTIALMVATSMGVFGFLSKAHLEQGAPTMDNTSKIERLEQQIAREKALIADNDKVTAQLDATVNSFLGKDRADRALFVRRSQATQRKQLKNDSDEAQKRIEAITDEKFKLESDLRKLELEVGPIRYIAELIYGSEKSDNKTLESAVRIFTLIIVSTLDPLAITLLIAANFTILRIQNEKKKKQEGDKKDPSTEKVDEVSSISENTQSGNGTLLEKKGDSSPKMDNIGETTGYVRSSEEGVTGDEKAALCAPLPLADVETVDAKEETKELIFPDWDLCPTPEKDAEVDDNGSPIRMGTLSGNEGQEATQTEILSEEDTSLLPQKLPSTNERSVSVRVEDGEDTDWEVPYTTTTEETEEVGISEEEKATLAEWLLRGKSYAGVRQPTPTQVIDDPATEVEATTDIPQGGRPNTDITALPLEISPGGPVVIPWAHQANVYRELVGDAHFVPQKINEEKVQERVVSQTAETGTEDSPTSPGIVITEGAMDGEVSKEEMDQVALSPFDIPSDQLAQTAKYPKTLSWLTEFRREQ